MATHGSYAPPGQYVAACRDQMFALRGHFDGTSNVLEFGCGIGGNLIAVAGSIGAGRGLDVNPMYVHRAARLARRQGAPNLHFDRIRDGLPLAPAGSVDFAFTIGVFERLARSEVARALSRLLECLTPVGCLAAYFLSDRARGTGFSSRLGSGAYTFWADDAIASVVAHSQGDVEELYPWGRGGRSLERDSSPATMAIIRRRSSHDRSGR